MAQNNTPIAEPEAVAAVGEEPVMPKSVVEASNQASSETTQNNDSRNNEARNNDSRNNDNRDDDDRDSRRGNRDRDRDDRDRGAGRLQGPTDLMPELDPSQQEGERKEVEDGRAYEISYIVTPGQTEASDATQTRLQAIIEGAQGAVDNVRVTESRRLAFPIKKQTEGVYVVVNTRCSQTILQEIDRFFKLESNVLRHIVLREGR